MQLPTEAEWKETDYTERRVNPHSDFGEDQESPYPTGNSPVDASWLKNFGFTISSSFSHLLDPGIGPSLVGFRKRVLWA